MIQKQDVFIKVDVNEELPDNWSGKHHTINNDNEPDFHFAEFIRKFPYSQKYWLKEHKDVYVFTEKELSEHLLQVAGEAWEAARNTVLHDAGIWVQNPPPPDKEQYLLSINK